MVEFSLLKIARKLKGWMGGQSYQYVAGLSPDWEAIEEHIFAPDLRVTVSKTIAFSDIDQIRAAIDDSVNQWERGKTVILLDEVLPKYLANDGLPASLN